MLDHLAELSDEGIEAIERLTMRWLFQAVVDFGTDPFTIFSRSPDKVKDVAEDVTRELLDKLGGYSISQRVFGTVDYKKARYIILPDQVVRQALFVDSKAEKTSATGTLQMSQISMRVRQRRGGVLLDEGGKLPTVSIFDAKEFLTTTMLLHYYYEDAEPNYLLRAITVCSIPNGRLQARYNATQDDTIWIVGRNAPTRGEDFRVRLSFARLQAKARWRVQRVRYLHANAIDATWQG